MKNFDENNTVLVTGASGMIGSAAAEKLLSAGYKVVGTDIRESEKKHENYRHFTIDLADKAAFEKVIKENSVGRIIHLAALAHSRDGSRYSWEDYLHFNFECAKNVFEAAGNIPVLFISTVDVYGFAEGTVDAETKPAPVSHYAKSKLLAEKECAKLQNYTIFRLSPVYTDEVKLDIQKRYYLRYPDIAYLIGKGGEYEVLNIRKAAEEMVGWCENECKNEIRIIKDENRMKTSDCIAKEKKEGRAGFVLRLPRWMTVAGYKILKAFFGKNKYTYLLNKAVYPLRSE